MYTQTSNVHIVMTALYPYQEITRLQEKLQQTCTTPNDVAGSNSELLFSCPLSNDDLNSVFVKPKGEWMPFASSDCHSLTSTQAATPDTSFKVFEETEGTVYTQADTSNQCSDISSDYAFLLDSSSRLDGPEMRLRECGSREPGERGQMEDQLESGVDMLAISQSTHDLDWQQVGESGDSFHSQESGENVVTDDDSEEENLLSVESTSPHLPDTEFNREVCHLKVLKCIYIPNLQA